MNLQKKNSIKTKKIINNIGLFIIIKLTIMYIDKTTHFNGWSTLPYIIVLEILKVKINKIF